MGWQQCHPLHQYRNHRQHHHTWPWQRMLARRTQGLPFNVKTLSLGTLLSPKAIARMAAIIDHAVRVSLVLLGIELLYKIGDHVT
jgi:hypothetical protein